MHSLQRSASALAVLLSLLTVACTPVADVPDAAGPSDAGPDDAGPDDAGPDDAGAGDAGVTDAGPLERCSVPFGAGVLRGADEDDEALGLAVGDDGALWVVGYEGGMNKSRLLPSGPARAVIARYAPGGALLDERFIDTAGADVVEDVIVDEGGGGAWALGRTTGALPGHVSGGQYDAFVARLEPGAAAPTRALQFGSARPEHPRRMAALPAGGLLVAGFSDIYVPSNYVEAWEDPFLAELTVDAETLEVKRFEMAGSEGQDLLNGLVVDPHDGSYYVAGTRLDGTRRGPFLEKRSVSGALVWEKQITPFGVDGAAGVVLDESGNPVVVGSTFLPLGGTVFGEQDVFVVKLDAATGEILWATQGGGTKTDWATDVALGPDGSIWVAGETLGTVVDTAEHAGSFDVMLLAFDREGQRIGAWQWGTPGDDHAAAVAVDPCGRAYVAGYASGALVPGEAWRGGRDLFVLPVERPEAR